MQIKHHWFTDVERVPTKKISSRRIVPKFIVYHYTAGISESGDLYTLAKSKASVSCQLLVKRDGSVIQMGGFHSRMWHAGPSRSHGYRDINSHSVGIEICNLGNLKVTDRGYKHWTGKYYNPDQPIEGDDGYIAEGAPPADWLHEKHPTAGSGMFAWEPYTAAQLEALDDITIALRDKYDTIKYGVSHEEIDTRGWKTDPGPAFPLKRYQKLLDDRETGDGTDNTDYWHSIVNLNGRSGPGMSGDVIHVLSPADDVVVVDRKGNWLLINNIVNEEQTGWVYGRYMERSP